MQWTAFFLKTKLNLTLKQEADMTQTKNKKMQTISGKKRLLGKTFHISFK